MAGRNYYPEIWKKSYMLELAGGGKGAVFYTFSLPPESSEFLFPQRITETKTFGGLFIDDYGQEACKITLSGTTGNSEIKKIFQGTNEATWMTGKQEIYHLRDEIMGYKKNSDYAKRTLTLYNFGCGEESSVPASNPALFDAWEVVLKDFKISQSKDRPFFYSYSIEFTGLRKLGEWKSGKSKAPWSTEWLAGLDAAIAAIESGLAVFEAAYAFSEEFVAQVNAVKAKLGKLKDAIGMYGKLITGTVDNMLSGGVAAVGGVIDFGTAIGGMVVGIVRFPGSLAKDVVRGVDSIRVSLKALESGWDVVGAWELMVQDCEDAAASIFVSNGAPEIAVAAVAPTALGSYGASPAAAAIAIAVAKAADAASGVDGLTSAQASGVKRAVLAAGSSTKSAGAAAYAAAIAGGATVAVATSAAAAAGVLAIDAGKISAAYAVAIAGGATVAMATSAAALACGSTPPTTADITAANAAAVAMGPTSALLAAAAVAAAVAPTAPGSYGASKVTAVTIYGAAKEVTVVSGMTLEKLAKEYLGNADLGWLIAIVNKISGNEALKPGTKLSIPSLSVSSRNTANVFSSGLGSDIKLGPGGIFTVGKNGDFKTVDAIPNMNQAISTRLSQALGTRVRLDMYGVRVAIGGVEGIAAAYLVASIKDTVMKDPRIASISNMRLAGAGDCLAVAFEYVTGSGEIGSYQGAL